MEHNHGAGRSFLWSGELAAVMNIFSLTIKSGMVQPYLCIVRHEWRRGRVASPAWLANDFNANRQHALMNLSTKTTLVASFRAALGSCRLLPNGHEKVGFFGMSVLKRQQYLIGEIRCFAGGTFQVRLLAKLVEDTLAPL
ncbi:MAG: hypothetical protein EOR72_25955 [Mesorhizobium sp.]|uniref:hypothetical protein n=1 Tax=Mesorhizobium sp. TaxID=1871066 RepID=UPI000FE5F626|nr:hypothetical protein [Mesorhizobium sp.]RWM09764.1 MAG: hypothetical protein EOR72_25955 [Mesorhizobium sp.]